MQTKILIVYLFLFSYSGAVAHSIVPHHHHLTQKEAKKHHDHNSHSHQGSSKKDKGEDDGQPYFLSHASNVDVLANNESLDNLVKYRQIQFVFLLSEPIIICSTVDYNVFHPPMRDRVPLLTFFFSSSLRAPPIFTI